MWSLKNPSQWNFKCSSQKKKSSGSAITLVVALWFQASGHWLKLSCCWAARENSLHQSVSVECLNWFCNLLIWPTANAFCVSYQWWKWNALLTKTAPERCFSVTDSRPALSQLPCVVATFATFEFGTNATVTSVVQSRMCWEQSRWSADAWFSICDWHKKSEAA